MNIKLRADECDMVCLVIGIIRNFKSKGNAR
jgi:hypothetical protein